MIEPVVTGMVGVVRKDRHPRAFHAVQAPLTEMSFTVTDFLQRLWQGLFLKAKSLMETRSAVASRSSPGEDCSASWGTD